ncbi:hypothetical protein DL98DRAFT_650661 [Cadophora sp. DSE1049]|nr:hypothetical protein DL98DRAFT_650661 [Cadophora sp. DSE1049]
MFRNPNALVTIIAGKGEDAIEFKVFNAAFNSEFIEGQTQTYRLEDISKHAMAFFVQYLYSQRLEIARLRDPDSIRTRPASYDSGPDAVETRALVELWVFAAKPLEKTVSSYVLSTVYHLTSPECMIRRYYIARCGLHLKPGGYRECPEEFPYEMLLDVMEFLSNRLDAAEDSIVSGESKPEPLSVSDYFVKEE